MDPDTSILHEGSVRYGRKQENRNFIQDAKIISGKTTHTSEQETLFRLIYKQSSLVRICGSNCEEPPLPYKYKINCPPYNGNPQAGHIALTMYVCICIQILVSFLVKKMFTLLKLCFNSYFVYMFLFLFCWAPSENTNIVIGLPRINIYIFMVNK